MNDRLADLRGASGSVSNPVAAASSTGDLEMGTKGAERRGSQFASANFMQQFFREVDGLKTDINSIKDAAKRINELKHDMSGATSSESENALSNKLRTIVDKTNKVAKRSKQALKDLQDQTQLMSQSNKLQTSELRIRENLVNTLTRKLVENVNLYQQRQAEYKDAVKEKVSRQVRIVKADATEEEIQEIMYSEGGTGDVFKAAILTQAADPVREAYEQAQDKYQDVRRLEQSVLELHQMFVDFALLIEQQGELLDSIEYQVQAASEYIEAGNEDIEVAIDYQKSLRKKYCCFLAFIMIIAAVIVAVILSN